MCNCKNELTLLEQTMVLESLFEKLEFVFEGKTAEGLVGKEKILMIEDVLQKLLETVNDDEEFERIFFGLIEKTTEKFLGQAKKEGYC